MKNVTSKELFVGRLPLQARRAFLNLSALLLWEKFDWYLGGGTALALQVGHRQSVDLDFFTPRKNFPELSTERQLFISGNWKTNFRESGAIYGEFLGAKVSLIAYPFFIPSPERTIYGTIRLLVPADIAVMKVVAISQRGRKRDFVDLFWYCRNREKMADVLRRVPNHYPSQAQNLGHFLKSLTYFNDADPDPMPKLFFRTDWRTIKDFFKKEVRETAKRLLEFPAK